VLVLHLLAAPELARLLVALAPTLAELQAGAALTPVTAVVMVAGVKQVTDAVLVLVLVLVLVDIAALAGMDTLRVVPVMATVRLALEAVVVAAIMIFLVVLLAQRPAVAAGLDC
jgi:hypothetical protein